MTRLTYETRGGQVSEADTYAKLLEYLRLAEESCYVLGHIRKANDDSASSQGWIGVGNMLARTQRLITALATNKLLSSTGGH